VREDGLVCVDTNSDQCGQDVGTIHGTRRIGFEFERLDLAGGDYFVDVGAYEHSWAYAYDEHRRVYPLHIRATPAATGVLAPPSHWDADASEPKSATQVAPTPSR
jgi:lipopolysaccharide transport system ATP-binding protein